jgi:broad specificity phosphatase PhoE
MRLYIIRHGETNSNVNRILQGHTDGPHNVLNDNGYQQVLRLSKYLEQESKQGKHKIDHVYVSDLTRARQTAEIMVNPYALSLIPTEYLRERSYGIFDGAAVDLYNKALEASNMPYHEFRPEAGESVIDLDQRVSKFLDQLKVKHMRQSVMLVGHAGTNRSILSVLLNKDFEARKELKQDNASLNIVEILATGEVLVEKLNFIV